MENQDGRRNTKQLVSYLIGVIGFLFGIFGLVFGFTSTSTRNNSDIVNNKSTIDSSTSENSKSISESTFACVEISNANNRIKLNVSRFSGDPDPTDIFVVAQFEITNNCEKTIIGSKGSVDFQNVVGDTIFTGDWTNDNSIKSGSTFLTSSGIGWTFNQFEDVSSQLRALDASKTKAILTLSKVVFEDGTSITD